MQHVVPSSISAVTSANSVHLELESSYHMKSVIRKHHTIRSSGSVHTRSEHVVVECSIRTRFLTTCQLYVLHERFPPKF